MEPDAARVAHRYLRAQYTGPLEVKVRMNQASFGLPKAQRLLDPETHRLLQGSYVNLPAKFYGLELGLPEKMLYEIHLDVHPGLQGQGYAARMIQALAQVRSPLYLSKARILNPQVLSVVRKLAGVRVQEVGDPLLGGWVITPV